MGVFDIFSIAEFIDFVEKSGHEAEKSSQGFFSVLFSDTSFWVFLATLILIIFFFWKNIHKLVIQKLDEQSAKISSDLEEARILREKSQNLLSEYKRELENIEKNCEDTMNHARDQAKLIITEGKKTLEAQIANQEKLFYQKLEIEKREIQNNIKNELCKKINELSKQLIQDEINSKNEKIIVKNAISEISQYKD